MGSRRVRGGMAGHVSPQLRQTIIGASESTAASADSVAPQAGQRITHMVGGGEIGVLSLSRSERNYPILDSSIANVNAALMRRRRRRNAEGLTP